MLVVRVAGFIDLETVAFGCTLTGTPVALAAGVVAVTVGAWSVATYWTRLISPSSKST